MKRLVAVIISFAFLFSQTASYAQFVGAMPSAPAATAPEAPREAAAKVVEEKVAPQPVSDEDIFGSDREQAMFEAVVEAEHKERKIKESADRERRLKGPMMGKMEKESLRDDLTKRDRMMDQEIGALEKQPSVDNELRRMKTNIPPNEDLGTGVVRKVNESIYPVKISGDYQLSWGYDWGDQDSEGRDSMWKHADWNDANMVYIYDNQYVFGNDRQNTYDKRIFDRFRLKVESVRKAGFNILTEAVVDPWSFVGKTDPIVVTGSDGSQLPVELRYWSNNHSTIGERTVLSNGADFVNFPEIRVNDGHTQPTSLFSRWAGAQFNLPPMEINREFRPMRKLEANYTSDRLKFKAFPLADQDHAYTSDDPLILSNKHIYWEPSPWLSRWDPAVFYGPSNDFIRGKWSNEIAHQSRDSDFNFLTLLRGLSFEYNLEDFYLGGGTSAPLDMWQDYVGFNSLPGAIRMKQGLFDNYYVGGIYTYNYGFNSGHLDAFNHVYGFDAGYEIPKFVQLRGEMAWSVDQTDSNGTDPGIFDTNAQGTAYRIESNGEFLKDRGGEPQLKVKTSFTHMGDNFRSRTSNYTNTNMDQFWGKHIRFEPVSPDFDAFKIGDGVDIGRDAFNIRFDNQFFEERVENLWDMRFVRGDNGSTVEDVYREELTLKPMKNLTGKFLFRYQDLPGTTVNQDPYIIENFISSDFTRRYLFNGDITDDENADVWTYSFGLHYDPLKWLGVEGIYERTNDHETFPSRIFNDAAFRDLGTTREFLYFLYGQPLIAVPPYEAFDIYKARVFFTPIKSVRTKFEYVINEFKSAPGWDDNISHWGVEADVDFTKRLTGSFKFIRSQVIDIFKQQQLLLDVPFEHHNNFFASLNYAINDSNTFVVEFGEFFIPVDYSPVAWMLNTLDTQRIVRFYLKGKF